MSAKTACVIIIGNEILTGRTQDVNLGHIGKQMLEAGIKLAHARVIPDIPEDIVRNVQECSKAYTYVFTTGGIGPTHDDITAENVAKAFGVPLLLNPEARARLLRHYGSEDQLTEPRLRMAMIPQGAKLIDNPVSTAPGFNIGNVYVMAGVPRIMQAMLDGIVPTLAGGPPIRTRSIGCFLPESQIAPGLTKVAEEFSDLEIGSYPYFRPGGFGLSLVVRGTDTKRLDQAVAALGALIESLGGSPVLGIDETAVPEPSSQAQSQK
jgi:molybdenum cofactor synthesis domain-containing protein